MNKAYLVLLGLVIFAGCTGSTGEFIKEYLQGEGITCLDICNTQPHESCEEFTWNITGEPPNCVCSYYCNTTTQETSQIWTQVNETTLTRCTPSWSCSEWSECSSTTLTQTRTCTDLNECNVITDKPAENQSCSIDTKNVYNSRESIELFGDKRYSEIVSTAIDYFQANYVTNHGCSPTPCNKDYWTSTDGGNTHYYLDKNQWTVKLEINYKNNTQFWYEYFLVTVDQDTYEILDIKQVDIEEVDISFNVSDFKVYKEGENIYAKFTLEYPLHYLKRGPLNIYTHPNKNLSPPFEFDESTLVQLGTNDEDNYVWTDDITQYSDNYYQLQVYEIGIELCDSELDVCEFIRKEYNAIIDFTSFGDTQEVDITPPTIQWVKINGISVNNGTIITITAGDSITITAEATDSLSGLQYHGVEWFGLTGGRTQSGFASSEELFTFTLGENFGISPYMERGTYRLVLKFKDVVGNSVTNTFWINISYAEATSQVDTNPPTYDYSQCFQIIKFNFDAEGNDHYNLTDEYVTIQNTCAENIDMTGWTIRDEEDKHFYPFPNFILSASETFTLYTGEGENTATSLYWGRIYGAVWNNDGDTLYLWDGNGNIVFYYSY